MKLNKKTSLLITLVMLLAVVCCAAFSTSAEMVQKVENVMYPLSDTSKTSLMIDLAELDEDGIMMTALYDTDGRLLEAKSTNVLQTAGRYTLSLDKLSAAEDLKVMVWNNFVNCKPLSKVYECEVSSIKTQPDEVVKINNTQTSYNSGATVTLDVTYMVGENETTVTDDAVAFDITTKDTVTATDFSITNGNAVFTVTGYGEVTVTAYPKNFADDEAKKAIYTFSVNDESVALGELAESYNSGSQIELNAVYTVNGENETVTEEDVAFDIYYTLDEGATENTVTADVDITDGNAVLTVTGYGEVTVTAYPRSFADVEAKKVSRTFTVNNETIVVEGLEQSYKAGKTVPLTTAYTVNGEAGTITADNVKFDVATTDTATVKITVEEDGTVLMTLGGHGDVKLTVYPIEFENNAKEYTFTVTEETVVFNYTDEQTFDSETTVELDITYTVDGETANITSDNVTFEAKTISGDANAVVTVLNNKVSMALTGAGQISLTAYPTNFENNKAEITFNVEEPMPDEAVAFNFSDDFLYRFGTKGAAVPIDITYTVDGVETELSSDAVAIDATNVMGTAEASVTIGDGKATMTLTGGGQITLTAYPKNFADDESKKQTFTFEVLENYYNVSSTSKTGVTSNFCLVENITNTTVALDGNEAAYGNNYVIDNSNYPVSANNVNGNFITLQGESTFDNFQIIGIYTDDLYQGSDTDVATNTPGYTWATVQIYGNATISNCHVTYGKSGVRVYSGTGNLENVTVYNAIMPINAQGGTTLNLNGDIVVDQMLLEEHSDHKLGATLVVEAGSPVTINVNGNIHFHSFMSEADIDKVSSTTQTYVKKIFDEESASFKFVKDGTEYVNTAFTATGSSADDVVLNVSENSNFYNKYSKFKETMLGQTAVVWSYDNTKATTEELSYLWEKPQYDLTAGFEQVTPVAYNVVEEVSNQAENGIATYDFSDVYFKKYGTNLSYTASASVGTIRGTTLSISATEDTTSLITYTVTDNFANKTYTYQTAVHATVPAYAPTIVFAAPSGKNPGSASSSVFDYKGRNCGNKLDPDFDIDLDSSYGFAAFDYKGNRITVNNTATSGARVTVSGTVTAGIQSTGITLTDAGYLSTKSNNLTSASYSTITVTYTAYDASGRSTTATRYYQISNAASGWLIKTYTYWPTADAYSFASRNGFSDITFTWNGVNDVTSSTNNQYIVAGEKEE